MTRRKKPQADGEAAIALKLEADIKRWRADPVAFVREQFAAEPDEWQKDVLASVALDPKVAMSACKGPGKSCVLAWIVWWFLVCHYDAQVVCVSITRDNLRDNLWKEIATWGSKSALVVSMFNIGKERIENKTRPVQWWVSARGFAQDADQTQQANTLAGLHNPDVMIVLDELGDYPVGVLAAAEAIFATKGQNARLVCAGNPTSTKHALHTVVSNPTGWKLITITGDPDDPKRSPRISLDWAKAEIAKHGRDNPWIMVNILGEFPPGGSMQLIPSNLVTAAMRRDVPARAYMGDARIWGIDPARFGDDEIVLMRRQGILARRAITWRNKNGTQLGDAIAHEIHEHTKRGEKPDAIFIDVGSVGSSAYDRLCVLGFEHLVQPVDFGGGADRPDIYANKRAEMWILMKDWLTKVKACLPNDPILAAELQGPEYDFRVVHKQTVYILEAKADMKTRGVQSPNRADALCLTFAAPVEPHSQEERERANPKARAKMDYDPLEFLTKPRTEYDPLKY